MKIKVKDYEIEIKAKDTSENTRFNQFDTEYALNELALVLVYARHEFGNSDIEFYKNFLSKRANEWFTAIDEAIGL